MNAFYNMSILIGYVVVCHALFFTTEAMFSNSMDKLFDYYKGFE